MKIGLIPLDERPVNTRFPQMLGAIAGVDVLQPPTEMLSQFRQPANCAALSEWLREQVVELDALVVSIEMLVHGGLVPSRISDDSTVALLGRLEILRETKAVNPALRIYGFNLITRISKNPESVEEPSYWRESGPQVYRYSQAWDAHRFVEDYCYMHLVRPTMDKRSVLYDDQTEAAMTQLATEGLNSAISTLADFREWRVTNVRLPWKRRFEVDFDLERA